MEVRIYKNVRFFSYLQSAKTSIPICVQLNDLVQEIPGPCSDPWSTSGGFVNSEHLVSLHIKSAKGKSEQGKNITYQNCTKKKKMAPMN